MYWLCTCIAGYDLQIPFYQMTIWVTNLILDQIEKVLVSTKLPLQLQNFRTVMAELEGNWIMIFSWSLIHRLGWSDFSNSLFILVKLTGPVCHMKSMSCLKWPSNWRHQGINRPVHFTQNIPVAYFSTLQWHHNERNGISNHWCLHSLLNYLFRCR